MSDQFDSEIFQTKLYLSPEKVEILGERGTQQAFNIFDRERQRF